MKWRTRNLWMTTTSFWLKTSQWRNFTSSFISSHQEKLPVLTHRRILSIKDQLANTLRSTNHHIDKMERNLTLKDFKHSKSMSFSDKFHHSGKKSWMTWWENTTPKHYTRLRLRRRMSWSVSSNLWVGIFNWSKKWLLTICKLGIC